MKTKNNVQKAILKSAAVIISLVLISFTVNAQNFWKSLLENETFSQIAMAMVAGDSESSAVSHDAIHISAADLYAEYSVIEPEESLKLEDWMTSDAVFTSHSNFETETEVKMELENWMSNENYFNVTAPALTVETESELELEGWMVNDELFNVENENSENKIYSTSTFAFKNVDEPKLKVENWMTDSRLWSK